MKKYVVFKDNGELNIVEANDLKDLFDKDILYGRISLETCIGDVSFWYDDIGLYKEENKVNYNASLFGNYDCFVGDIIIDRDRLVGDGDIESLGFTDEEINKIVVVLGMVNGQDFEINIKRQSPKFVVVNFEDLEDI